MTYSLRAGSKRKGATQQSSASDDAQLQSATTQQQSTSKKQKKQTSSSSSTSTSSTSTTASKNEGEEQASSQTTMTTKKRRSNSGDLWSQIEPSFDEIAAKPEELLLASTAVHKKSVEILKALYDYGKDSVYHSSFSIRTSSSPSPSTCDHRFLRSELYPILSLTKRSLNHTQQRKTDPEVSLSIRANHLSPRSPSKDSMQNRSGKVNHSHLFARNDPTITLQHSIHNKH